MNPAPAKGVESFPTPVIDDVVIAEVVNAWKGDYKKLDYGTLWKDISHAPNQGSFPEHKLVYQQPTSEDGQWVKRIWVNDRANQDSYNYAIKYSAGSQDHPIYIRTYVVPRETYAPLPDGTPDPLFPSALLVDEEANRVEGELDSKYISVTRAYETLPGPQVPTKRYNERGDLETVIVQTVPPNTPPDPDGLLVTQSQVVQEEMGKGVKTTATVSDHALLQIKEKKGGLLGETITTDDIVDPATNPDALSQTVVSSVVEQFSATKARKRTTTATGPKSLKTNSIVDSPLGLVNAEVSKSIVKINEETSLPSDDDNTNLTTVRDSISAIDAHKAERENIKVDSWPINTGVDYDEQLGIGVYYTETIVDPKKYIDPLNYSDLTDTNYRPLDQWKSLQRSIDRDKVGDALLEQWLKIPSTTNIQLPDKLLGITIYWGKSYGAGNSFSTDFGASTGSYSLSTSGSGKNSYGINGDIYFNIQQGFSGTIKSYDHIFFMKINKDGRVRDESILDVLNNFEGLGRRSTEYNKKIQSISSSGGKLYVTTTAFNDINDRVNKVKGSSIGSINLVIDGDPTQVDSNTFSVTYSGGDFPETSVTGDLTFYYDYGVSPRLLGGIYYQPWPFIQSRTENLVIITGGKSETASSSASRSVNINGYGSANGRGSSIDVNVNARSINIPATLHDKIDIKEESFGTTGPQSLEPTYGIRPKTLAETTSVIDGKLVSTPKFPVGNYLYASNVQLYKWGFVKVTATTVEITENFV